MSRSSRGQRSLGLRFKFSLFVSVGFAFIGVVFGAFFSQRFEENLRAQFEQRGTALTAGFARNSWVYLISGDEEDLRRLVAGALEEPDVIAAAIYDERDRTAKARAERVPDVLPEGFVKPPAQGFVIRRGVTEEGGSFLSVIAPVRGFAGTEEETVEDPFDVFAGEPRSRRPKILGSMVIVFGLDEVERSIDEVQRTAFQITAITVGGGVLLVILLSRIFVTPIERIAAVARKISAGDREERVVVKSRDELGELADAFNAMTQTLAERERELREVNLGLEQKVKERTRELERKQQQVLTANVELERANRLKSEFLANMSHELRTPLNAVNGFSELLLEQIHGPLTAKQQRYAQNILNSGRHLLQLINDILDLSKIEAGRMDVHWEQFSLRHAIDNAINVIQPLAQKKNLLIVADVEEGLDEVHLDQGKMRQVLYNLMSNAVKFTDEGRVTVKAHRVDAGNFEIVVEDSGIGIKPDDQGRIFREFEQVDGSHARRYEGTGLGLALTRRLVEIQGGAIRLESEYGKGSRFFLRLPLDGSRADAGA